METKPGLVPLRLIPAKGGVIVESELGPPSPIHDDSIKMQADPPHVFTDHEELCNFLFSYFVDTEAELKKRASK